MDLFKALLILLAAWIVSPYNGVKLEQTSSSGAQGQTGQTYFSLYDKDRSREIVL